MIEVANQRLSQANNAQTKEPVEENQIFDDTARPKHVLGYVPPKSNYMPNQVNWKDFYYYVFGMKKSLKLGN